MPLETASYPTDLVTSNPAASDGMNNADDHMRLIKAVIKNALAGVNGTLTRVIGSSFGILVGDGIIGAPGIAFLSDTGTGFSRTSTGIITVAGQLRGNGTCPPGAIMDFAMDTPPLGWIVCDGASWPTTTFPDLFAAIGYTWGGSGANFNVPNFMNRYRRHRDNGPTSGIVGTLQADSFKSHTHTGSVSVSGSAAAAGGHGHTVNVTDPGHSHTVNAIQDTATSSGSGPLVVPRLNVGNNGTVTTASVSTGISAATVAVGDHTHTVSASGALAVDAAGSTETRPLSATVLTCIKV